MQGQGTRIGDNGVAGVYAQSKDSGTKTSSDHPEVELVASETPLIPPPPELGQLLSNTRANLQNNSVGLEQNWDGYELDVRGMLKWAAGGFAAILLFENILSIFSKIDLKFRDNSKNIQRHGIQHLEWVCGRGIDRPDVIKTLCSALGETITNLDSLSKLAKPQSQERLAGISGELYNDIQELASDPRSKDNSSYYLMGLICVVLIALLLVRHRVNTLQNAAVNPIKKNQ